MKIFDELWKRRTLCGTKTKASIYRGAEKGRRDTYVHNLFSVSQSVKAKYVRRRQFRTSPVTHLGTPTVQLPGGIQVQTVDRHKPNLSPPYWYVFGKSALASWSEKPSKTSSQAVKIPKGEQSLPPTPHYPFMVNCCCFGIFHWSIYTYTTPAPPLVPQILPGPEPSKMTPGTGIEIVADRAHQALCFTPIKIEVLYCCKQHQVSCSLFPTQNQPQPTKKDLLWEKVAQTPLLA